MKPRNDAWEIDLVPLLGTVGDDPAARLVGLIIVSDGYVLRGDVLSHPPAEPNELAAVIERALSDAITEDGHPPKQVQVRHESIAQELAPMLSARHIEVVVNPELPGATDAGRSMRAHLSGEDPDAPPASAPETWAGWGLAADQIARLFMASADYYRAAPWITVADDRPLAASVPGRSPWMVVILGNAGVEFGLAMYADPEDLAALFETADPREVFAHVRGPILSLTFGKRTDVSPAMRREIRDAGWEVAGPSAYPLLVVLGTPGGGIAHRQMDEMIAVLESVPRFVVECERLAGDENGIMTWTDPATGVALTMSPEPAGLWSPLAELAFAGPEGPGARSGVRLDRDDEQATAELRSAVLERFATSVEGSGRGRKPSSSKHTMTAQLFLDFLTSDAGIPPHAVTELDLREFLYRWYPQKVLDTAARAKTVPGSLKLFFDFLEREEGVVCAWARPILEDREAFMARWKSRRPMAYKSAEGEDWVGELTDDLVARVLLPAMDRTGGIEWGRFAGMVEADLWDELQRRWLVWRDAVIRSGVSERDAVARRLLERQREWSKTPNAIVDGQTPERAIAREQKAFRKRG